MENHQITMFNGKILYKWSFSIAMSNYQRVDAMFLFQLYKSYAHGTPNVHQFQHHLSLFENDRTVVDNDGETLVS